MGKKLRWREYSAVAMGGVIGASLREGIELLLNAKITDHIPMATMFINWGGSLILAWFYTMTIWRWHFPQWVRAGIGTGIIGAFTTFSTFSVESVQLLQQNVALGMMYVFSSIIGGMGLSWIGIRLAGENPGKAYESKLETSVVRN